jgi:hypothetical protein
METKFKILETEKYTLAVSDKEVKLSNDNIGFFLRTHSISTNIDIIQNPSFTSKYKYEKIIAYQPKGNAPELDLPLLPEEECCEGDGSNCNGSCCIVEDDVEKLAKKYINDTLRDEESDDYFLGRMEGFKDCYKSATKKYSEDDLRKAIAMAKIAKTDDGLIDMDSWISNGYEGATPAYNENEIIQSLKQPKWFVAEVEYYYHSSKELYSDAGFVKCTKEQYESIKSEIPTCPLKIELKTIDINNKIHLVGTYLN